MALVDNFESYTLGALPGQGSWTGGMAADFRVQGGTVKTGAQAADITSVNSSDSCAKAFTGTNNDSQLVYINTDNTNARKAIQFFSGSSRLLQLVVSGGDLFIDNGTTTQTLVTPISTGTWYLCEVVWRSSDTFFAARVDAGVFSTYIAPENSYSTVDTIKLASFSSTNGILYIDDFAQGTPPAVTGNKNLLLMGIGT